MTPRPATPRRRAVIVNADDFGYSNETVAATIAAFERGALTSATIMPAMPGTAAAIAWARAHPELSFGAHLTWGAGGDMLERPVLEPARVPAMVDARGRFLPGREIVRRAMLGRVPADQIEAETRAQIGLLRDHGLALSHVDSHGHLHKFAPFLRVLRRVLPAFGIDRVRRGQNVWIRRRAVDHVVTLGGALLHPPLARWFRTTDRFFMPTGPWDLARRGELPLAGPGTLEIGVHPGSSEPWRRAESEAVDEWVRAARAAGYALCGWGER
jgi:predicted glycoside hydrolase/deacetylase ChbG (UPF0249 family)